MARKINFAPGTHAEFSPDHAEIYFDHPIEGVRLVVVTYQLLDQNFWQWKGWGECGHVPLNGSMINGELVQLFEISPDDPDLYQ